MSDKAQSTIRIKWVRSAIGFSYLQKRIVRSLGLKKLNQEVEKPDTPQVRGLVAKVPHLVQIVEPAVQPAWMSVPEYTIYPSNAALEPSETGLAAPATEAENSGAPAPAHSLDEGQRVDEAVAQVPAEEPGVVAKEEERAVTGEAATAIPETATKSGASTGISEEERPKTSEAASSEEEKS